MGKVKVANLGDEELAAKDKAKKEAKKAAKKLEKSEPTTETAPVAEEKAEVKEQKPTKSQAKTGKTSKKKHSSKYLEARMQIDAAKKYALSEALDILPKVHLAKFDETVELHINTTEPGVSGTLTLPHGTGKKVSVVVADDAVLAAVEKGKIEFDILVAHPSFMPKLAKVAKVLGPKGLMPNPKNGTVTTNPEEVIKKFEGGQVSFKTESKLPVLHISVGKMSFGKEKLSENIKAFMGAINSAKIKNVTLKSTMSPGIKVDTASI